MFFLIVLQISIVNSFLLNLELNNTSIVKPMLAPSDTYFSYFTTKSNNFSNNEKSVKNNWKSVKSCLTINYQEDNSTLNHFVSFKTSYLTNMCFFDCSRFNNFELYDSVAMKQFCPLQGTVNKATIYTEKEVTTRKSYDFVMFMEGCFYITPNGTKEEVTWIMDSHFITLGYLSFKNSLKQVSITRNITFDNLNSNCEYLCTKHTPVCKFPLSFDEEHKSEINVKGLIYFISILCLTFFGYLIFNCFKEKLRKRVITIID